MAESWIEDQALRFEGFNDAQIAQIKAALPKVQQLLALVEKNEPLFVQLSDLGKDLIPVASMVTNVIKGRMT